MKLVILTGLSGAGKSMSLKILEDLGFEAVDNIPLALLPSLVKESASEALVVGADVRSRDFSAMHFREALEALRADAALKMKVVFLDCDDEVLRRRFTETRRRHPIKNEQAIEDNIRQERKLLEDIRELADFVIDTSDFKGGDLRQVLTGYFSGEDSGLSVTVESFSYKKGLPREADLVFDVRFLRNPFYDATLKAATGKETAVGEYVASDKDFHSFFRHLCEFIAPLLPRYQEEGKSYLTIAVGCTGGRHRSVFISEKLAGFLSDLGYKVGVKHRDLDGF